MYLRDGDKGDIIVSNNGQLWKVKASLLGGGAGVSDGTYGDITVSGGGLVWTIVPGSVNSADLGGDITTTGKNMVTAANVAAQRSLLGLASIATSGSASDLVTGFLPIDRGLAFDPFLLFGEQFGSTLKGCTVGLSNANLSTNLALADAVARFTAVYLPKSATLTGVAFISHTVGVFTGDAFNGLCLYTISAGTLTKVAETANNEAIWKNAANSTVKVPFTSTYVAAAGFYWVGALYNNSAQTTAPAVRTGPAPAAGVNGLDYTNSVKVHCSLNAQSTLPASPAMSSLTVQQNLPMFWLY